MKAEPQPQPNALQPGLQSLIDRGLLSRCQAEEVTAFAGEIHDAVIRGEMTLGQADAMGQMLGVRYARGTNARLARRSLQ